MIRSPINGVVLSRSVEPGQTVAAAFQSPVLFTLAEDLTQMELQVDVDEADVGKVREGQKPPSPWTPIRTGPSGADHAGALRLVHDVGRGDLQDGAEGGQHATWPCGRA